VERQCACKSTNKWTPPTVSSSQSDNGHIALTSCSTWSPLICGFVCMPMLEVFQNPQMGEEIYKYSQMCAVILYFL